MVSKVHVLFALFCLAAAVVAEAPAEDQFQKMMSEAKNNFDNMLNEIKKHVKMPEHGDDVINAVKEESKKVASQLEGLKKKIDDEIAKNPEIQDTMKKINTKVEEAINNLKAENPEIASNAEKLNTKLKSAWDSVNDEIKDSYDKFVKSGGAKDFENLFNNFFENAKEQASKLQEKIHEITKHKD